MTNFKVNDKVKITQQASTLEGLEGHIIRTEHHDAYKVVLTGEDVNDAILLYAEELELVQ